MKIRTDFVTNSSSSSFILSFGDYKNSSWEDFEEMCNEYDYLDILKIVKSIRETQDKDTDKIKESAIMLLKAYYADLIAEDFLKQKITSDNPIDKYDYRMRANEFKEFKENIDIHIQENEKYQRDKKRIEESNDLVVGTIWDTSGGLAEWAIRNGFLDDELGFWWCICDYCVG